MPSHLPIQRIQTRLKPKQSLQFDLIITQFYGDNYQIASDIFSFIFSRGFMRSSTQRFTSPPSPLASETPITSEPPVTSEIRSEEQIQPANRHYLQFDNHGVNAFLDSSELQSIDPKILIGFAQGTVPRDQEILGKIAMYALQYEPNVFLWLIGPHSGVTSLSFAAHGMGNDHVAKLTKLLQGNRSLTSLNLYGNNISAIGAKEIGKMLPSTTLKSLNLEMNDIGAEGAAELAQRLPNTTLTSLNLASNSIGVEGAKEIAQALPGTALTFLNLGWNDIGDGGTVAIAKILPNTVLTSINLEWCSISDVGATEIAQTLPNTALTFLSLELNYIGDAGATKIAEVLPGTALTSLDLKLNNIGDAGVVAIANVLPYTKLISLNLERTGMTIEGASALATLLDGNNFLTSLTLSKNDIGDAGAKEIARVLPNTILTSLDLRWCDIKDEGITALADALKNNGTLTTLDLFGDNLLDDDLINDGILDDSLLQEKNSEAIETIRKELEENLFWPSEERQEFIRQLRTTFIGSAQVPDNRHSGFPIYGLPTELMPDILKYVRHKDLINMQRTHRSNLISNGVTSGDPADTNTTKT
jgi:hypothetical protein